MAEDANFADRQLDQLGLPAALASVPLIPYASDRAWWPPLQPATAKLNRLPRRRTWSVTTNRRLRAALVSAGLPAAVRTIAVAGSLGRLEATSGSDVDWIVVLHANPEKQNRATATTLQQMAAADQIRQQLADVLNQLQLPAPNAAGIFVQPVTDTVLTSNSSLGKIAEPPAHFGCRLQLLLDAQPVYQSNEFELLIADILARYQHAPPQHQSGWLDQLLDDLNRYRHALRILLRWEDMSNGDGWHLQQIKFYTSRTLMFAGLLFLLAGTDRWGRTNTHSPQVLNWLQQQLHLTPIERVAQVADLVGDTSGLAELALIYDECFALLDEWEQPTQMMAREALDAAQMKYHLFQPLVARLRGWLLSFFWRHAEHWGEPFLQKMLF